MVNLKPEGVLLVVNDIEKSKELYINLLGLEIISDFGANVAFKGGIALNEKKSWTDFIDKSEDDISFGGNNHELYFETENLDDFVKEIKAFGGIEILHEIKKFPWGQRVIRFYDFDKHIIEVAESMKIVCKNLLNEGMTVEKVAEKTMFPVEFVKECL